MITGPRLILSTSAAASTKPPSIDSQHEFLEADDALPDLWVLYHQFRRIESKRLRPFHA